MCDDGEGHVICRAAKCIGEACAVEEERDLVCAADGADDLQFIARVERPVLRRLREVDHPGAHHMIAVRILVKGAQACLDGTRCELAVRVRQGEHLVPARLDRTRLVHGDMAGVCRDDALIGAQERRDHDAVRLRAAREEVYLRMRCPACRTDLFPRRIGVYVEAVARRLLQIRLCEPLQNLRMRALHIVRGKGQPFVHESHLSFLIFFSFLTL